MKKRFLLLTALCPLFFVCHAQTAGSQKTADEIEFNGYLIRLFQTPSHGYGYDIFLQHALVYHQINNPYTNAPEGLKKREDAIKTAKWQAIHLSPSGRQLQPGKQTIPMEVATQLKITIN